MWKVLIRLLPPIVVHYINSVSTKKSLADGLRSYLREESLPPAKSLNQGSQDAQAIISRYKSTTGSPFGLDLARYITLNSLFLHNAPKEMSCPLSVDSVAAFKEFVRRYQQFV